MEKVTPQWSERIVFICGIDRGPNGRKPSCGPKGSEELRDYLKARLKQDGLWRRVRVTTASCLDVCSGRGVTLTIQGSSGEGDARVVDAQADREELYAAVVEGLL